MNVCVDASLVVKWLVPEEGSDQALKLYKKWFQEGVGFTAPALLEYEIGSVLRQKIVRGLLQSEDLFPIFDFYGRLNILMIHVVNLMPPAIAAAASLNQATIYDTSYLLTARQQNIDFVTADERFYKAAHGIFSFVKFYQELI